ncbi:MAG TPA: hypothetical protein VF334_10440, partial [Polyangia bacterium]
MRALAIWTLLVIGCGAGNQAPPTALVFDGSWSGTLSHPAANCSDGSVKAAFSTTTSFQINQDQAGLFLIWMDRCPAAGNIPFTVDARGTARQQGDPALCVNSSIAQASFSSGTMTVTAGALTLTINETEHDSGTQTR